MNYKVLAISIALLSSGANAATHLISGEGSLIAIPPTSALVNSQYSYSGEGTLSGDTFTYTVSQETENLLGLTYITSTGILNTATGEGTSTLVSCLDANGDPGSPLVCADIDAVIGTPDGTSNFLTDGPVEFNGSAFQWTQSDIITFTGAINGTGQSTNTYFATPVPVPAAAWLFGSALIGLAGIKRKQ